VRSKVEHVFGVMKLKFGFCETALPRTEEECQPAICGVRAGEPVLLRKKLLLLHQHSPAAKTADRERATEAGRDGGKNESARLPLAWPVIHSSASHLYRYATLELPPSISVVPLD